ncbi:hypothetical protein C7974DRAFT_46466 [Boeremia exigua]|uniref:uncharacterized protein n=1 Tax=Boeremia exigua TaxID=749465 RepID=UPI001E8DB09C|nr:uncharacterized protein C7974DRAFT_46466 [Boeremia exigua]KAH6616534.1 hypothetical protein C7974DRAFT_46466 [Boeremia exigua]
MAGKTSNVLAEQLQKTNLKNYAKYLTEHGEDPQHFPELRADHDLYFQFWVGRYSAALGQNAVSNPRPRRLSFLPLLDQPTSAAVTILNLLGYTCELSGESLNIIRFRNQPCSVLLWITGSPWKPQDASEDHALWRELSLHTPRNSKHLRIQTASDLSKLFGYVAAFHATFASNHLDVNARIKARRSKPFNEKEVLNSLCQYRYEMGQPGSSRFIEAARQVERGFILDAVVEMFAPLVGIVARFISANTDCVDFHQRQPKGANFLNGVQIWRANDVQSLSLFSLRTYVLVTGLESDEEEEEGGEDEGLPRYFSEWLQNHGLEVPPELHGRYKSALLYDMASPSERYALVFRIRIEKDRHKQAFKEKVATTKAQNHYWEGKYCPQSRYELNGTRMRRNERLKRCRERRSKLSTCVTHEIEEE